MIIKTQNQSPLLVFNSNKSKETKNAWFTKRLRFLRKIFTKKLSAASFSNVCGDKNW